MALRLVDQQHLHLVDGGNDAACGVACVRSVLASFNVAPPHTSDQIFRRIRTSIVSRQFGTTPGAIANYLVRRNRQVWFSTVGMAHTPLTMSLSLGLISSNAVRLTNPPQHGPLQPGGPPYFIHTLKIAGIDPRGHFVVSDGLGSYMDPGSNPAALIAGLPTWKNFYDAGLTIIVE